MMVVTEKKRLANRRNGARSRGPKTAAGKANVSQNARRHGLAAAESGNTLSAAEIETISHAIVGAPTPDRLLQARIAARSMLVHKRARQVALALIAQLENPSSGAANDQARSRALADLAKIERYERRALSRQRRVLRALSQ